ncbi:unnamed protein product [Diatraea saccharalis]|uniref:Uncharacterized protein n=1 Tax=Diatraea saccharalis TaxID=40085 RepID=A0A9N9QXF0_9NEOP|nr:unnamed protein product [Diatraea saccharalis]
MHRFVTIFAATLALAACAPQPTNVFEIDISPEEAQKYLNSPPFTEPQLSGRTAVLPLVRWNDPRFRTAEAGPTLGHYWKNGHEIENTDDYVEEVYDASQFHGQDGLGAYTYGYKAPESAKVENRVRSGDVTGSYTYKSGNNDLIKVRYWADSEGFHQEDNLPKVQLQPAQETEEVRQARLAHEKAWKEAAEASLHPNAQQDYSASYHEYQPQASEVQAVSASAPGLEASVAREGKAYVAQAQSSFQGNYQQQYQQPQLYQQQQNQGQKYPGTTEQPEPTGPPRGFFYSFNYPVSIIVPKSEQQSGNVHPGFPVDSDTVSVNSRG